jgi:hypothetical protein
MKKANKAAKAAKPAVKKAATKAAPKKKAAVKRTEIAKLFDQSVTSVARALGALKWKPADAIKALKKLRPALSEVAVRNSLYVGRNKIGAAPAKLSRANLAQLKKAAA